MSEAGDFEKALNEMAPHAEGDSEQDPLRKEYEGLLNEQSELKEKLETVSGEEKAKIEDRLRDIAVKIDIIETDLSREAAKGKDEDFHKEMDYWVGREKP